MSKSKGILFAILSSATFGLLPFFSVPLLNRGMHVTSILSFRNLFCAVVIFIICLIRKKKIGVSKRVALMLVFLSILYAGTNTALIYSYRFIPTGLATTVYFLYPIVVTIWMVLFFKEKKSLSLFFSAIVSLIGVGLLCKTNGGVVNMAGVGIVFISVFAYATYIVNINTLIKKNVDSDVILFYVMLISAVLLFLFSECTTGFDFIPDKVSLLRMIGLTVISTVLPTAFFMLAVKNSGPTITSILGSMEPLVAMLVGIIYFSEPKGWNTLVGFVLILISVITVILTNQKNAKKKLTNHPQM